MSDNIKVVVKIRPLISREIEEKQQHQWRVNNNTLFQLDSNGRESGPAFTFDKVYCENAKTSDVYNDVAKPIVEAAVAGFNGTIFAYGQTSSGKTYTMTGTNESLGIIPLAVLNLFEIIKKVPDRDFVVSVSYIEIYNESLRDLLDLKKTVNIKQTYSNVAKVDATDRVTASPEEVLEAMKEGNANRQTAYTNMNESSSRSHSIFQINIESREHLEDNEQVGCVNVSQLNLVDLAGSERAGQTGATGLRFKEGTSINKSLTSLALVIKHLSEDPNKYINYRDSKLTRILQNSLGGNAKTSIICAITPAAVEETNSTLQFATRAKIIKNKPEVNAVATDATMIQKLTKELSTLQSQLESKKNLEVMLESKKNVEQDLQKKIANLQRFILNFGQRPNVELMGGARRKLQPPRRITISTLHPIEENVTKVQKFNTPLLKYNPSLVQNAGDFFSTQNSSKSVCLSTLPEEPPRLVTPPPNQRKVNINDEVIELDSDDDDCAQTCSPYHSCHDTIKTPPCVLKKNAQQAEKSLKDLEELTEREKMYTPSVVELIEKIEQSTTKTTELQEEIEVLKTISKEKDLEIEALKSKISTTEEDFKSISSVTVELETLRREFNTKLTDWQVSYETLKNKANLRERELLSLLEEQRIKQADVCKTIENPKDNEIVHFMSRDISLVNSDSESSIVSPDDNILSERTNIIIKDMQAQLAAKNETISQLETDIKTQKLQIQRLEKSSYALLTQVDSFKEELKCLNSENSLLQSTVIELNRTIKSQKENLELAQNDMSSYNSLIQELQIKLTKRENLLNNDIVLESMLKNEDKTMANNENIKNIISSLKLDLENIKKENDELKSKMQNNNESEDKDSVYCKSKMLNEEISKFTKQANEHTVTINTLLREKSDLAVIEQELIQKISEVEQKNHELEVICKDQTQLIENLKNDNERLRKIEKEHSHKINKTINKQLHEATDKIVVLEEDIKAKQTQIDHLNTKNDEFQDCLKKVKLAIQKLQNVLTILTGSVREIPDIFDSFVVVYSTLNDNLNILEEIAVKTVAQKDLVQNNNLELKNEMSALELKHRSDLSKVTKEAENLYETIEKLTNEIKLLKDYNTDQTNQIEKLKHDFEYENTDLKKFEMQVTDMRAQCSKDLDLCSLKENEVVLLEQNGILETKVSNLNFIIKSQEDQIEFDKQRLIELEEKLQQQCIKLKQVEQTLHENEKENVQLVEIIVNKLTDTIANIKDSNLSVKNILRFKESNINRSDILLILDAVVDCILLQTPIENENKELKSKVEEISSYNKSLECDMKQSSELLQQIQEELKLKSTEIGSMEYKAKEWKQQFIDLDRSMKEQMLFLQSENEKLKNRSIEQKMQYDLLSAEKDAENFSKKSFKTTSVESGNNGENSLPSLVSICLNRINDILDQRQSVNVMSTTTSSSCISNSNTISSADTCQECEHLVIELRISQQENIKLMNVLEQLQIVNKELSKEHSEMNEEVHLLLELTQELQKKITNHRTNLSILTATTYTENKSLKSQVKGLQHHHSRFHNVCQRDIPEFKKQLNNLMSILNDSSSFCGGFKRFSLPNLLENTPTSCHIRNESTFDSDLFMLDTTNASLTTADNTLVGYNQTCLDLTQTVFNETDSQAVDCSAEPNMLHNRMDILKNDNEIMSVKLAMLTKENLKLKEQVDKNFTVKESKVKDTRSSPIKISGLTDKKDKDYQKILKEKEFLSQQLSIATQEKKDLEIKYNDLVLEMPSTDALIYKMKTIEEDLKNKVEELSKMLDALNSKSNEAKALQEENDSLSTQVMEHILEVDDLNKTVIQLKQQNLNLLAQCSTLELENKSKALQYGMSDNVLILKPNNNEHHTKLNRSLSDSDSNSRHNKICSLQSEIHAGREDCKVLTEDVVTIKQHLDHTNMSMDLDESMNFELASDSLPGSPQSKKCNMPDIQEKQSLEVYLADKYDCYHYYLDKTGKEEDSLPCNLRMIEVMKSLYENLVTKHVNEVENLANKLKDYQELHTTLQTEISVLKADHANVTKDLENKDKSFNFITSVVTQLRDNLRLTKPIDVKSLDLETYTKISDELKDNFLSILDKNFNLSCVPIFEQITNHTNKLIEDFSSMHNTVTQMKYNLSEKEKECNFLKAENDKIRDINNAVTLDIIKTEEKTKSIIKQTYQKLVELNMICSDEITLAEPVNVHVLISLLEHFINKYQKQKAKAENPLEIQGYKDSLAEKETQLNALLSQNVLLQSIDSKTAGELCKKDEEIISLKTALDELNTALNMKEKENFQNQYLIQNLSEDIKTLKETMNTKEKKILSLHENVAKANELLSTVKNLQDDNIKLKAVNEMITAEAESYASELQKSCAIIKQNNNDIDKMTSDILVLRESLKEATAHMEHLKQQVQTLTKENVEVKQELEIKSRNCSRLEVNIKTHEKTAEVQNRMIIRLQKQKEEDDYNNTLAEKNAALQAECEASRNTIKTLCEELDHLKTTKQSLENRLAEAEDMGRKSRLSIDAIVDSSKRRRQSLHDSKRLDEFEEHRNLSAAFDDDNSGRSTPFGPGIGRDSLLSRTDHSDKDDEPPSRPSSALTRAARRRRQSSHDLHRSVTPNAPSPTDLSKYVIDELEQLKTDTSSNRILSDKEITQLRSQLASCEQELEDLKDRYRELDEECETCAEYLRERDEQCIRLKKEKTALETQVMELKAKAATPSNPTTFKFKASVAHVAVNTDEDWTNLHAVVVDRMSYDAEVEKNKKLAKTIDELRFAKLELKNTLTKMQKALEKNAAKDNSRELEQTKTLLKASNEELKELRTRYKELDEECETCAKYLKEREEQCRTLKEAKVALEAKLEELQEKSQAMEHTKSMRKKRQTIYDKNRPETSSVEQTDASTETMDGLNSQVECDDSTQRVDESARDLNDLKKMVGKLTRQKMHLEMQLRAAHVANPMFVATGSAIVQNQQITDVMKENQKLKKINLKLINMCKKRSKSADRENEDPCDQS